MAQVTIELEFEDRRKETRSFGNGTFVIGRDSGDVVLGDPLVSGQHAEITVTGDQVMFFDVGSTNGSFFNSTKVTTPIMLSQGEGVRMGNTKLLVKEIANASLPRIPVAEQQSAKRTFFAPGAPAPQAPAAAPAPPEPAYTAPAPAPAPAAPAAVAPPAAQPPPPDQAPLPNPYAGSAGAGEPPPPTPAPSPYAAPGREDLVASSAAYDAAYAAPPRGDDPIEYFRATVTSTWELFQPRIGDFAKLFGIVLVGGTAIITPISLLAPVIALPLVVAMYLLVFFGVMGMAAEYCLHLVGGQPITINEAFARQKKRFATSLLSTFLAGLLSWTFILGVYMFQVQIGERRENFDINSRVFELFKGDWKRIVVTSALTILPILFGALVIGLLQAMGGVFSVLLFSVVGAVFYTFAWSFFMLLTTRMYYDSRRKVEGVDAIPTVLQTLNSD